MIYFGRSFYKELKTIQEQPIRGIILGERNGHGRDLFVPVCRQAGREMMGLRRELDISPTRSGRPRISHSKNANMYLFLSCRPEDTEQRGSHEANCHILLPAEQPLGLVGFGCGKTGKWYEVIVKAQRGDVFAVRIGDTVGHCQGWQYYMVTVNGVMVLEVDDAADDVYRGLQSELGQKRECFSKGRLEPWKWTDVLERCAAGANLVQPDDGWLRELVDKATNGVMRKAVKESWNFSTV